MKRLYFTLILLFAGATTLISKPVGPEKAQLAAKKFAEQRFAVERQQVELVKTGLYDAYYIYNIGNQGFVIIAADDAYRPVIGYSNESVFDVNNIPPALEEYLNGIAESINRLRVRSNAVAAPLVAAEWESMLSYGRLISRNGGRGVDYLCQTKWDQSYPYNYCCPEDPNGSGGHAIVGCLATAMSQLMRFWAYPAQGIGSHCYYHEDYGQICADFGNTTYDWANMPNQLNSNASEEEKLATGTLCFHCGVTIDMGYGPDGSGGASGPIPGVMHTYFNYSDAIVQLSRNDFETETWKTMVREQFDMGWPMYYGGCQDGGCHAFVCDGYDDYDMFHFNLGWGGSSDGWYIIDEAPYTSPADAMFNFVPAEVYGQTPMAPTGLSAEPVSESELKARLTWTNPTATQDGSVLIALDSVLVMRNNRIIMTLTDMVPGADVEVVDEDVPFYDTYHYAVCVIANGRHGRHANVTDVAIGPSCTWKVVKTSSEYYGWKGGFLSVYNSAGHEIGRYTMTSSTPTFDQPSLPLGTLRFGWSAPEETVSFMGLTIRDSQNNVVFSFSGSSDEMPVGVFLEMNNSCGGELSNEVPDNLVATAEDDGIRLSWNGVANVGYGYNLYRDDVLFRLIQSGTSYLDEEVSLGGHCYRMTVLGEGGENGQFSNESCASFGPCYPPRNLDYELASNYKIKLLWEAPLSTDELTGYYLYRRQGKDGEYKRIKLLNGNVVSYTDTQLPQEGDYYYRLCAYYRTLDCFSAPANWKYDLNIFELHVYYSPTGLIEEDTRVQVYPNPTNGLVTIVGESLCAIEVYDALGQSVLTRQEGEGSLTIDLGGLSDGLYFIRVMETNGDCIIRKLVKQNP